MSRKKTQFVVLPNEIIYSIFNFLTTTDIVRAFEQLNRRYTDLVRFYVKQIDLTDGWPGDRQHLQWFFETIQALKVDQLHIHLLANHVHFDRDNVLSLQRKETVNFPERNTKSLLHSVIKKIFVSSQKASTPPRYSPLPVPAVPYYHFPLLQSLHLVNVFDWNNVISGMNLTSLNLEFDDRNVCYLDGENIIPQTITRFSANVMIAATCVHANLIDLNICVRSIDDLFEIVGHTPNVQYLSATFAEHFPENGCSAYYQPGYFKTIRTKLHYLSNLTRLSFRTKDAKGTESNARLPFDQIQVFIDRCCPKNTVLEKIALKFDHIIFHKDMWLTIVRYKHTFDRFDFYASFVVERKATESIAILSTNDHFDFHIEGSDASHPEGRFIHVYSLPFAFDELYGFSSCSELSSRCSFLCVRHLYFTQTRLARPISFQSLARRMPNLISIDCHFTFVHDYCNIVPEIIVDADIFINVRILRFTSHPCYPHLVCHNLLPRLLDRMPHLRRLVTSESTFIHGQLPLPPIQRLILQEWTFKSFDILIQRLPHLSILVLSHKIRNADELSQLVVSLFIGLPSLTFISFMYGSFSSNNRTPDCEISQQALARAQSMDNRLRHLRVTWEPGITAFYLQNS